ncbi:GspH/FimT family pseudopilin [Polaromonas sp. YR568]|uniref:GspH/FimT family pseudopilin n=1 Tax=Polaromonas sp. YR568 TaxID=1855301 RepID=UPI00398C1EDB
MLAKSRQRGFNVIEVMVTVAVLALLLAVGVPSMAEWVRNTHVRNLAETIQNGLQKARTESLRRNKVVTFWMVTPATGIPDATCTLSAASGSWVISLDDPSGKCNLDPSATTAPRLIEVYGAGSSATGVTVTGLASDGATAAKSVSFNGFGQTVSTGTQLARIDVAHTLSGARRLRIQISTGGGVRMCDQDVSTTDPRACH